MSALSEHNKMHESDASDTLSTNAEILPEVEKQPQQDVEQAVPVDKPAGPPPGAFDPRQNPDGGREAWLVVAGGFCCLFCSFGWINCIGVFQNYYETHQLSQYSASTIAWIPSCEAFMMFVLGPVIGKIYDNYGPRWLLVVGTILHVFGLMMTSLASELYQFILAQGICSAAGASMVFYPAMSTVSTWFFHKRAFAFGCMAAGSSLGGVIFPIMVAHLIPEVGFAWTMRICAFLILGLMIIANLTVRSRIPPFPKPVNLMEFVTPLRELPFVLTTLGSFLFFFGMFLPINYIILQAGSLGMSSNLSQYLVSILNAASLFGRTLPGFIADKIGRFNTMIFMTFFTGIIVLALWIPAKANAPIIVFAALYGFGSGAFVSLAPAVVAQISDVRQIGVRTGTLFAIISFAALASNPVGGALVSDDNGKYIGLQVFCGVMACAGGVAMVGARLRLAGPSLKVKV